MQIVPFTPSHWEDAAALVAARVHALRANLPLLPARYEGADALLPRIAELAGRAPGVAALEGARLVGFLTAMSLPSFKGKRAAFSPEWANAVAPDQNAGTIYQALYAALAPAWLANGCYLHALRVFAHDRQGLEGLYWQGFGLNNVDAVRDLAPLAAEAPGAVIRRATAADIETVTALGEALYRHLAAPPIYLPLLSIDHRADYLRWLAQPGHVQWLALAGDGAPVAEMRLEPSNDTVSVVADDGQSTYITSAYTVPSARNGGLAAALLAHAIDDARAGGYARIVTDFESANIPAAAFWMRHFQPLAYSVVRYVDERAGYAHAERRAEDFW